MSLSTCECLPSQVCPYTYFQRKLILATVYFVSVLTAQESDRTLTFKDLQILMAPQDIREMAGRFSDCERTHAPAFDIVGPKVVEAMAKVLLGVDSPWLGVFVGEGKPKFPAIDAMMINKGDQSYPATIEMVLGSVADQLIAPDDVTKIADKVRETLA